ncbi:hypothetical protein BH772_gp008 [Gordonia phage Bachita]|uniref:Lipoprotein n=1 Tax=Gordonia phage Bachita TaxID=1838061 RepID=A0A166YAW3_9CAUD|nr:hypothetical protein BH772_gp008 [Gordonia phage Bachita]ANA86693.1 hypothetical protein PBI_BACHITA_8 [Gordonia phage Bachita]WKW85813.1 hypothetical protein SEA_PHINKBODEN_8 [Gordonia Phage PhinkBoden]
MNTKTKAAVAGAIAGVLLLSGCGDIIQSGEVIEKDDRRLIGKVVYKNNLKLRDCVTRNDEGQCRTSWIRVDDRTYESTKIGDWHQHTGE